MTSINISYKGDLQTECTHVSSNAKLITDAPKDNQGKGEKFSPTDLFATSLGTCLLTIMGIKAKQRNVDITGTKVEIGKVMANNPRRVAELNVRCTFPARAYTKADKTILERVAATCPVARSLHPDVKQNVSFIWPS